VRLQTATTLHRHPVVREGHPIMIRFSFLAVVFSFLTAYAYAAPNAPMGLASSSIMVTSFTLKWTAATGGSGTKSYSTFSNGTQSVPRPRPPIASPGSREKPPSVSPSKPGTPPVCDAAAQQNTIAQWASLSAEKNLSCAASSFLKRLSV
jgi:hypothetical protein